MRLGAIVPPVAMSCTSRVGAYLLPLAVIALHVLGGCGAKTGLKIPDASRDASVERDGGTGDAGVEVCTPEPVVLRHRGAEVMFVIDRSTSMSFSLDGGDPEGGERDRWEMLRSALANALDPGDRRLHIGAKFFPQPIPEGVAGASPQEACSLQPGIDLVPGPSNVRALLQLFAQAPPNGGTPTAAALQVARDFLVTRDRRDRDKPRFIVLATDGAPNCNPNTGVHHTMCTCTGSRGAACLNDTWGPYNCLDDDRTLGVIRQAAEDAGIPVFVVGIGNPTRPELVRVLDEMAVAGGVPRSAGNEHRYYSARRPAELRDAFANITDSISSCVFQVEPTPAPGARVTLDIAGEPIPRDRGHRDGWDWTGGAGPAGGEITLFGEACERARDSDAPVQGRVHCEDGGTGDPARGPATP